MAYTRVNWEDLPSTDTPINATNLNKMDKGIKDNYDEIQTKATLEDIQDNLVNVSNEVDEDYRVNVLHSNNLLKYPYLETTKTQNGITFTDNGDGSITISGTATANASFSLLGNDTNQFEIEGNYLNGGVNSNIYIRVVNHTSSYTILGTSSGSETHINKSTYKKGYIEIRVNNGTAITTPITIKPIMTKESYSGEWQPYITPSINVDNEMLVSKNVYSSGEVVIGEWFGKPLYRKVIDFGSLPNATNKSVNHNISNIDKIVNQSVIADNGSQFNSIPYLSYTTLANGINFYSTKTLVNIGTGYNWSAYSAYVILEYTKTTD